MKNNLDILFSSEFARSVEANIDRDPVRIALDKRLPHAATVASQVKYLQRARIKLPSYYSARCILPTLAFEQSSSEATAARKEYSSHVAVDLTCGLGVDSFWLSKRFERVIAIERDPLLAAVARENFLRLGARNIEVINGSAEEFLSHTGTTTRADLVYADPDRRGTEGKKLVRLEDCSPDIVRLLPQIEKIAPRLAVKLSPLFDVDEVFRVFGAAGTRTEVVSLDGECKEVIADITFGSQTAPTVKAVAIGIGEFGIIHGEAEHSRGDDPGIPEQPFEPEQYRWLVIPDVALQKARLARKYLTEHAIYIDSDNGYGFAAEKPDNIMGKVLEIESIEPFDPKDLKRRLRPQNIENIDILKRNFPLSTADIARSLGIRAGGPHKIAFTKAANRLWQIILVASK